MEQELKTEKLIKLLALTTSPNENEALVAMKKANSLLNESNKTWEQVISDKSATELTELKPKFEQLIQAYRVLEHKYNSLFSQAAALVYRPQIQRPYRKRRF